MNYNSNADIKYILFIIIPYLSEINALLDYIDLDNYLFPISIIIKLRFIYCHS